MTQHRQSAPITRLHQHDDTEAFPVGHLRDLDAARAAFTPSVIRTQSRATHSRVQHPASGPKLAAGDWLGAELERLAPAARRGDRAALEAMVRATALIIPGVAVAAFGSAVSQHHRAEVQASDVDLVLIPDALQLSPAPAEILDFGRELEDNLTRYSHTHGEIRYPRDLMVAAAAELRRSTLSYPVALASVITPLHQRQLALQGELLTLWDRVNRHADVQWEANGPETYYECLTWLLTLEGPVVNEAQSLLERSAALSAEFAALLSGYEPRADVRLAGFGWEPQDPYQDEAEHYGTTLWQLGGCQVMVAQGPNLGGYKVSPAHQRLALSAGFGPDVSYDLCQAPLGGQQLAERIAACIDIPQHRAALVCQGGDLFEADLSSDQWIDPRAQAAQGQGACRVRSARLQRAAARYPIDPDLLGLLGLSAGFIGVNPGVAHSSERWTVISLGDWDTEVRSKLSYVTHRRALPAPRPD